jgi:hypothetical protein
VKYQIVSAKGKSGLEANVNSLLADGWQLAGGVAADAGWFYQAMTKVEFDNIVYQVDGAGNFVPIGEFAV